MNYPINFCYHPTKVIFVDDDEDFLKGITLVLKEYLSFKTFTDPLNAVEFFNHTYHSRPFIQRCYRQSDEDALPDQLDFKLDMRLLHYNELRNKERFEEIAVAIVDYAMPTINGIELSRQLKAINPMLKIILLTGEADEHLAIGAFNEGVIDQYVQKLSPNTNQRLLTSIVQLQNKYFFELTQSLIGKIDTTVNKELRWLHDPAIVQLFNSFLKEKNIVEYYIIDLSCNFILIDASGKAYWFAIADETEMNRILDEVEPLQYSAEELIEREAWFKQHPNCRKPDVPEEVINAIKSKEKLPFFFSESDLETPYWEWGPYLHVAHKLQSSQNTYYYSLIPHPSIYEWPPQDFESYQHFLKNQS